MFCSLWRKINLLTFLAFFKLDFVFAAEKGIESEDDTSKFVTSENFCGAIG